MAKVVPLTGRVRWADLCRNHGFRGRWVAMDDVRYEAGAPVEGHVVDSDEDLAALCARVQSSDRNSCAILFCEEQAPQSRRAVH